MQLLDALELHVVAVELDPRAHLAQLQHRGDPVGLLEPHVGDVRERALPRARLASVERIGTMSGMSRQSSRPATGGVPSWSIEIESPSSREPHRHARRPAARAPTPPDGRGSASGCGSVTLEG